MSGNCQTAICWAEKPTVSLLNVKPVNDCADCGCSYVNPAQIRSFLSNLCKQDDWPLAQQMIERASRLFDDATNQPHGFLTLAGETPSVKILRSLGSRFLPTPPHIPGSVDSVHSASGAYAHSRWAESEDGRFLILDPCKEDDICPPSGPCADCSCSPVWDEAWAACVLVSARWGYACMPGDVEQAVLEMTAQMFRRREPIVGISTGLGDQPLQMWDETPLSWKIAVRKYKSMARARRAQFA